MQENARTYSGRFLQLALAAIGCGLSIAPLVLNIVRQPNSPSSPADWTRWPMPALIFFGTAAIGLVGMKGAATGASGDALLNNRVLWVAAGVLIGVGIPTVFSIGYLIIPAGLAFAAAAWIGADRHRLELHGGMLTALVAAAATFLLLVAMVLATRL